MSLTRGLGPLARPAQGRLNGDIWSALPAHALYAHPEPRRVTAVLDGTTVLSTDRAVMLHETGLPPVWYLPVDDFSIGVLERSDTRTHCPFKGDASYYNLRVGGRLVPDAAWFYADPLPGAAAVAGTCSLRTDAVDEWYEEDQQVFGPPTDPFHRVDVRPSSRHVVVRHGETVLAESRHPVALFETGFPARFYLPEADVRATLRESDTSTVCPYKGTASYWSLAGPDGDVEDVCWSYPEPHAEAAAVAGLRCFAGAGVTTTVDGVEQ
ncbi:DUF427 domain-containing protein [Rhodococcus sp. X156]|uniref:DUF427 domain-containing protein n=1 Tax=Rhodococcus sp. X156 TaxID=2499145 RepID=UPI000FDB323D|nr:DUF427 domain-containing protein [Rhodococcus sp. X156]